MKKYFRFLTIVVIIVLLGSASLLAPLIVNAGTLADLQISLTDYEVSATGVTYTISFDPDTNVSASDDVIITFATGIDLTSVVAGNVTIESASGTITAGTVDITGQVITIPVSSVSSPDGVYTITVPNVTNPADVSSDGYVIVVETNNGSTIDRNSSAIYIGGTGANQVTIAGTVETVLNLSLSGYTCNLGVLSKDYPKTCSYTVTVGTNADLGYGAYIQSDGDLADPDNGAYIQTEYDADNNDQIDNDALLSASEYGVGVKTTDTNDVYPDFTAGGSGYFDCASADSDSSLTYDIPVGSLDSTTAQRFAYSADPVDGSTTGVTTICHVARISGDQLSGSFTQTVTITVTGNF